MILSDPRQDGNVAVGGIGNLARKGSSAVGLRYRNNNKTLLIINSAAVSRISSCCVTY